MTRERLVWLLAVLGLALGAWWLSINTEWVEEDSPRPATGAARDNPVYAAEQLLRRLGMQVVRHEALTAMPPERARLVLLSSDWELMPERAEQLQQWVQRGGHLVLMQGAGWHDTALKAWVPIEVFDTPAQPKARPRQPSTAERVIADLSRVDLASTPPLWADTERFTACKFMFDDQALRAKPGQQTDWTLTRVVRTQAAQAVVDRQDEALQAMQAKPAAKSPNSAKDAKAVQALRVPVGQGSVTLLNTPPFLFFNGSALRCDNPLLLAAAVQAEPGATVWIYLHEKREALLPWLWHSGWIAILAGALALAAALWRGAVRFGPRIAPSPRLRRSISEQVRGLGAYLQSGGREALLTAQQRALHEVAQRRLPRYERLPLSERVRAIAAATGLDAEDLASALTARICTRAELPQRLQLLETARRRLKLKPLVQPHAAERGASDRSPEGMAMPAGSTGKRSARNN